MALNNSNKLDDGTREMKCTNERCIFDEENDENKDFRLKCNECKREVHYICSQLTVLGIQCLLDAKSKRKGNLFKCCKCMPIDENICKHMARTSDPNQSLEMEELVAALERASFKSESEKKVHEELESDNSLLSGQVNGCKRLIKNLLKSERKLQGRVEELQTKLISQEQEQKNHFRMQMVEEFKEALDHKMTEIMEKVTENFQNEALLKIERSLENETPPENKDDPAPIDETGRGDDVTYSRVVKSTPNNVTLNVDNVHNIIREAKNKELEEERQQKLRANNIIIHGVEEADVDEKSRKKCDEVFVTTFLQDIYVHVSTKTIVRLGQKNPGKRRPLKVSFTTVEEKERVMGNLSSLKGKEDYKGISITEDYTIEERNMIKNWTDKAIQKTNEEPAESNIVWKVRGNPKNGLWLKKFQKRPLYQ